MELNVQDMERIIHLDMKGAPPKISYLEQLFPLLAEWGATGLLVEWEDTFPYSGELYDIGALSRGAGAPYTADEVTRILNLAHANNLTVTPLVQTAGHMEFVLRGEARRALRESPLFPNCLCMSHPGALPLVCAALAQVLALHPRARAVHIGADEVWDVGACDRCRARSGGAPHGAARLYLEHVRSVASFLRRSYPLVQPVMWDDMLRPLPLDVLLEYQLGALVQPMVWNYSPAESFRLCSELWDKYAGVFPELWIASAFKGASGSCQIVPPIRHHTSNHEAWRAELQQHATKFRRVRGIAMTGWSRYDHYATLCELLPLGVPSLAYCLLMWRSAEADRDHIDQRARALLGCEVAEGSQQVRSVSFPGWELSVAADEFLLLRGACRDLLHGDTVQTWLNPWQLKNNFTNPMQTQCILRAAHRLLSQVSQMEERMSRELRAVLRSGAEEWLGSNLEPLRDQLLQLARRVERQLTLARDTHPPAELHPRAGRRAHQSRDTANSDVTQFQHGGNFFVPQFHPELP